MQHDVGAGLGPRRRLQGVAALAFGRPGPGLVRTRAARRDGDPVGDHEGGVEADAELADEARLVLRLGIAEGLAEGPGAGAGDGAEVLRQLGLGHADAGIRQGQGARRLVGADADLGVGRQGGGLVGQGLEATAVHGVGRIGHQFPQKDLAVGIEGVDHEVQQAPDLGTEFVPFHGVAQGSASEGFLARCARYARGNQGIQCYPPRGATIAAFERSHALTL